MNDQKIVANETEEENELRKLLHNTIDCMSILQLRALTETLFGVDSEVTK